MIAAAGTIAVFLTAALTARQAELTRQALLFGNRAFIFQSGVEIGPKVGNFAWPILVNWQNTGNTPAINAIAVANMKVFDSPLDSSFGFPDLVDTKLSPTTIGPKGQVSTGPLFLRSDDILSLARGKYGYIWGRVTYRDQLDARSNHVTMVCQRVMDFGTNNPDIAKATQIQLRMQPCPFHNCVDDDCKKYIEKAAQ